MHQMVTYGACMQSVHTRSPIPILPVYENRILVQNLINTMYALNMLSKMQQCIAQSLPSVLLGNYVPSSYTQLLTTAQGECDNEQLGLVVRE